MRRQAVAEEDGGLAIRMTMTDKNRIAFWQSIKQSSQPSFLGALARGDWAEELGIDLSTVDTYDEWYDMLTAFKDAGFTQDFVGSYVPHSTYNDGSDPLMLAGRNINAELYQIDGTVYYGPYTPEFKDHIEMYAQWYAEGLIDRDFYTRTAADNESLFLNGRAAVGNILYIDVDRYDRSTLNSTDPNWTPVKMPTVEEGGTRCIGYMNTTYATNSCVSITTAMDESLIPVFCQYQDYLYTDEGATLSNYGIEGETFYVGEDGKKYFMDFITNNPDGLSLTACMWKYAMHHGSSSCWYDWERELSEGMSDKARYTCAEVWDSNLEDMQVYPTLNVAEEHLTEYTQIYGDIQTYVDEWVLKAVTGIIDWEAEYDGFIQELENLGVQTMISYAQDAMDAFNERDITVGYED